MGFPRDSHRRKGGRSGQNEIDATQPSHFSRTEGLAVVVGQLDFCVGQRFPFLSILLSRPSCRRLLQFFMTMYLYSV